MKKFSLFVTTTILALGLFAQDQWIQSMQDPNVNFYEVQRQFNNYWEKIEHEIDTTTNLVAKGEAGKGRGYTQYKRWEAFWEPRVAPSGDRPNSQFVWQQFQAANKTASSSNAGDWTALGPFEAPNPFNSPYPGIGRINCITFDPTDGNIIWAGTPAGGLWKSTDNGVTWSTNTDDLPNLGISSIAIDPVHPDTMYIATGDRDGGDTYSYGILKSTDGGVTWNTTGLTFSIQGGVRVGTIHIVPTNTQTIIVAARNGIHRSTDGGATWSGIVSGSFNTLAPDAMRPNVIYAGTVSPARLYQSKDFGLTWTQLTSGLPTSGVARVEIAVSPQDSNYVYALYSENSQAYDGVYQSTNGGTTWTLKSSSPNILGSNASGNGSGGQSWYDLALAVSPTNKNVIFVGGVNIWRSNNQGSGWICVGSGYSSSVPYVHPDIHYFKWQPGTNHLWTGSDGGVFKTANNGSYWSPLYYSMNITQYYRFSQSETNPTLILAGAQDNGTHLKNGTLWDFVLGGDGMDNAIDPDNNAIMYASSQNGYFRKSVNGGNSFNQMSNLTPNGSGNWTTPIVLDPSNSSNVYIGYTRLWKSPNKGFTWAATSNQTVGNGNIDHIAIAPSDGQVIYVSIDQNLYRSDNGGTTWNQVSWTLPGSASISDIAVSSKDPNHVWVTRSGYSQNHKVFESFDGGATWINIIGSLVNLPVNCIVYEDGSLDGVYIGTDIGVYYKDALMSDWQPYFLGMPNVIVNDLEIYYAGGKIRAGTYGRGMWEASLFANFFGLPEADFSVLPTAVCSTSDTIQLLDESLLGPNEWKWSIYPSTYTFVNGTADTTQNPQVVFNTKGLYTVTLVASNSYGSDTKTKPKVIAVGGMPLPFTEDFEDASFVEYWQFENPDNSKTWEAAIIGGTTPGNQAIMMDFYNYSATGAKDGLITPPLSFAGYTNINLTFDHAYRRFSALESDSLKVYISTDCGSSWTLLQAYGENGTGNWVTGSNSTTQFSPTAAADWCGATGNASCKTISLNSYAGNDEVRIKFEGVNDYGNNLFLDNINILGTANAKPIADFIGDTTGCTTGEFSFYDVSTSNPTSWSWSMPGATPSTSTMANPTVTYTTGGSYAVTLIASNAAGSDTIVQTAFVNIDQAVVPSISISAANTTVCEGDSLFVIPAAVNGGSNPTYVWYRNNTFEKATNGPLALTNATSGDVFKCVMIPSISCVTTDSVVSNSVTITVLPLPVVTLNNFTPVCFGEDPFPLTGGTPAGGTYSGNGVSNGIFDPTVAGIGGQVITYTYTATNGCVNSDIASITVNNGPPKPTVTYNNLILKADPISTSYTYQWFDGQGNAIAGATDTAYIPWVTGDYTVQLTFINGCTSMSNPYTVAQVSIDEETLANGIKLFPNPVKDILNAEIVLSSRSELTVRIINIAGQLVHFEEYTLDAGLQSLRIDVDKLPAGSYIIEVNDDDNSLQKQFVKQ